MADHWNRVSCRNRLLTNHLTRVSSKAERDGIATLWPLLRSPSPFDDASDIHLGRSVRHVRQLGQGLTCESIHGPLVHRPSAHPPIETDRRLVPVQHRPFHPTATSRDG